MSTSQYIFCLHHAASLLPASRLAYDPVPPCLVFKSSYLSPISSSPGPAPDTHAQTPLEKEDPPSGYARFISMLSATFPKMVSSKLPRIRCTKTRDLFLNPFGSTTSPLNAFLNLPPSHPNRHHQSPSFLPVSPHTGHIRSPSRVMLLSLVLVEQATAICQITLQFFQCRRGADGSRTRNILGMHPFLVRGRFCPRVLQLFGAQWRWGGDGNRTRNIMAMVLLLCVRGRICPRGLRFFCSRRTWFYGSVWIQGC